MKFLHIIFRKHFDHTRCQFRNALLTVHFVMNRNLITVFPFVNKILVSIAHIKPDDRKTGTDRLHQGESEALTGRS